jgi:hypothetical protein
MPRNAKRRRLNCSNARGLGKEIDEIFKAPLLTPATEEEKTAWKGWCELESEPVRLPLSQISTYIWHLSQF